VTRRDLVRAFARDDDGGAEWNAESLEREVARLPGVVSVRTNLAWQVDEKQAAETRYGAPGRL
jgi:hypothetical protein